MLLTNLKAATMKEGYGLIEDAAILIDGSRIAWVGPRSEAPSGHEAVDCEGRLATPGLIDCHTHLVYGGSRAHEFEQRLTGVSYAEIARAGGGIASTVRMTRSESEADLAASALRRLDALLAEGVTTIEVKSGYGLDRDTEIKMLKVARELSQWRPVDVVTTYLGAHALPPEVKDDRAGYLDLVCNEVMPAIAQAKLADAVRRVSQGLKVVDPALAADSLAQGESPLTARETDVLACAALGSTNAEIAAQLGLREGTIKAYLGTAMSKLDASTRHAAVTRARRAGLLP